MSPSLMAGRHREGAEPRATRFAAVSENPVSVYFRARRQIPRKASAWPDFISSKITSFWSQS